MCLFIKSVCVRMRLVSCGIGATNWYCQRQFDNAFRMVSEFYSSSVSNMNLVRCFAASSERRRVCVSMRKNQLTGLSSDGAILFNHQPLSVLYCIVSFFRHFVEFQNVLITNDFFFCSVHISYFFFGISLFSSV